MPQNIEVIVSVIDKATGKLSVIQKQITKFSRGTETITTQVKKASQGMDKLRIASVKTVKGIHRFPMEFLGMMFFGMLLQRTFTRLGTSALESFMKITGGATPAGKAVNALAANMELLKFSIGNALASALLPLLPVIINIIEKVSDWIQQHPQLVAGIIIAGAAIGGFMFIVGSLQLALSSIMAVIGGVGGAGGAGSLIGALGALGPAVIPLAIVAAIVGAFIVTEWDKIKSATEKLGTALKAAFEGDAQKARDSFTGSVADMEAAITHFAITGIERLSQYIITVNNLRIAIINLLMALAGATKEQLRGATLIQQIMSGNALLGAIRQSLIGPQASPTNSTANVTAQSPENITVVPNVTFGNINVSINSSDMKRQADMVAEEIMSSIRSRVVPVATKSFT